MAAAAEGARRAGGKTRLLGVTVLTSMGPAELKESGVFAPPEKEVVRRALLAARAGLDGVVASPREARSVREAVGPAFAIVTPGVRPIGATQGDQARTETPGNALRQGADYLVVGRPIRDADDPLAAARAILKEIADT